MLYTLMKADLDSKFLPYIFSEFHAIRIQHSLRSKRLRASYCAKVGVTEGKGEGEKEKPPSYHDHPPLSFLLFALVPPLSKNTRGNAYYAGYFQQGQGFQLVRPCPTPKLSVFRIRQDMTPNSKP